MKRQFAVQTEIVGVGDEADEVIHQYEHIMPLRLEVGGIRIRRNITTNPDEITRRAIPLEKRADDARQCAKKLSKTNAIFGVNHRSRPVAFICHQLREYGPR